MRFVDRLGSAASINVERITGVRNKRVLQRTRLNVFKSSAINCRAPRSAAIDEGDASPETPFRSPREEISVEKEGEREKALCNQIT